MADIGIWKSPLRLLYLIQISDYEFQYIPRILSYNFDKDHKSDAKYWIHYINRQY